MAVLTPEVYTSMGLNKGEYERILQLMGREPTLTELGMFAVMWSEHCGYKYSRPVLAYFKRYKEALEGKGFENAGIVDIVTLVSCSRIPRRLIKPSSVT